MKVQENQKSVELNGTHQFLVYLLGENINTINKNIDALSDANKDVILEICT
jgi:hypothetical protein